MTARGGAPRRGLRPTGQAPPGPLPFGPASDDAALDAARAGDLRAWGYLIRGHQGLVFRTAWLTIRDARMAEESTTVAFARAYRSLPSLETGALLRPWLMGITAATSRAEVRKAALSRDEKTPVLRLIPRLPAIAVQRDAADPMVTETEEVDPARRLRRSVRAGSPRGRLALPLRPDAHGGSVAPGRPRRAGRDPPGRKRWSAASKGGGVDSPDVRRSRSVRGPDGPAHRPACRAWG